MVSYADFITLMFALFVVMYSVSSVNAGKYRVLSDTFGALFADAGPGARPVREAAVEGIFEPGGDRPFPVLPEAPAALTDLEEAGLDAVPAPPQAQDTGARPPEPVDAATLAERAGARLAAVLAPEDVRVRALGDRVEIELNSSVLFDSASARVAREALAAMQGVAEVLRAAPGSIRVEGFTDDRPIATEQFPSNWELSAARAASVSHLLARLGIEPQRLAATGYAQYRPVADNGSSAGRERNRRVVIVAMAGDGAVAASGATTGGKLLRVEGFPQRAGPEL